MRGVVVLAFLVLAGCYHGPSQQEIAAQDDMTCRSYGINFGTPEYAQCRQNIVAQRQANMRAVLGSRPMQPAYQAPTYQIPTSTTTSCNRVAGQVTCQTY